MNEYEKDNVIVVSVLVFAYNHKNYIRDTLDSIMTQKTDFLFEVIVHDDVSTDGTREIIKEYADKFPSIIIPIFQSTNQFSINSKRVLFKSLAKASGKYIAWCEGDDYWTDIEKLQRQVDYMETHPGCSLCFHASKYVNADNEFIRDYFPLENSGLIAVEEIIENGGSYITTNSMMFPQRLVSCLMSDICFMCNYFDYTVAITLSLQGSVYYENRVMSVYRVLTPNSWTLQQKKRPQLRIKSARQTRKMLAHADKLSHGIYHESFKKAIRRTSFQAAKIYIYPLVASNKMFLSMWNRIKKRIRGDV